MSVWIIDNGRDYSDNSIYFVDVANEREAAAVEASLRVPLGYGKLTVEGKVEVLEWPGTPRMAAIDFCAMFTQYGDYGCAFDDEDPVVAAALDALTKAVSTAWPAR